MASDHLRFFEEVGKLKHLPRQGWVLCSIDKPERVAGHMYRMAIMAMSLKPVEGCDMSKVVQLALVHDMAECQVGDITPHDNVTEEEKHDREMKAVDYLTGLLSNGSGERFSELFNEYENRDTPEAKLTKDLDRFDMVLQAFQYEKSELTRTGSIPNLSEFFNYERVLGKIVNEQIKDLLATLLDERKAFHAENFDKLDRTIPLKN